MHLFEVATGKELAILTGTSTAVFGGVAFSPDSKLVATGASDGSVRLWDIASRKALAPLQAPQKAAFACVAFSPDGKTLAAGGSGGALVLWDVATGKVAPPLAGLPAPVDTKKPLLARLGQRPEMPVQSVAFSPDGKTLARCNRFTITLWDVATRKQRGTIPCPGGGVTAKIVFSPNGSTVAGVCGLDLTIRLWDTRTGRVKAALKDNQPVGGPLFNPAINSGGLAFSPNGKTLVSASVHRTAEPGVLSTVVPAIRVWDVAAGQPRAAVQCDHMAAVDFAFSPDGAFLASSGLGPTANLLLWRVEK